MKCFGVICEKLGSRKSEYEVRFFYSDDLIQNYRFAEYNINNFIALNSVGGAYLQYYTVIPRTYSVFYGHRSKNKL